MAIIILDQKKCSGCGLCSEVCGLDVIVNNGNGRPRVDQDAFCHECGHCAALCPKNAITIGGSEGDGVSAAVSPSASVSAAGLAALLLTKRSCREFTDQPVEKKVIEKLIAVARLAPSEINCQERSFIVVTDPGKIAALREALIAVTRSNAKLLTFLTGRAGSIFLSPEARLHLRRLLLDMTVALRRTERGDDFIFHRAPCLIFFTGVAADPAGKDNALGALYYLMLYAETLGLGSAINGYAQFAPKVIGRLLPLPKYHKVYGAVMLGYRKYTYKKSVARKPASVVYQ